MRYCLTLALSWCCLCFISHALAASFALHVEGQEPLYQMQLNNQVYQHSRSDHLQDLIVKNADGEPIPYALVAEATLHPQTPQKTWQDLAIFPIQEAKLKQPEALKIELGQLQAKTQLSINTDQSALKPDTTYLIDLGENHAPFKTFIAHWQGQQNQLIQLELLISNGLIDWQKSGQAVLLSTQHELHAENKILQNRLSLDSPSTARYLQIKPIYPLTENPFTLTQLSAEQIAPSAQNTALLWQEIALIKRNEDSKKAVTELDFEALGHYPASRLSIGLPQDNTITSVLIRVRNNSDAPWITVAHVALYRINKNGRSTTNPAIEIAPTIARFWQLQFSQTSGGIGKSNPNLKLGWQPDTIIWNARGAAPFSLQVGERVKVVNQVNLNSLIPNYKTADLEALPKATLQPNAAAGTSNTWEKPLNYQRYVLWAGLVLGVLLLAGMAYSLFKSTKNN